MSFLLRNSLLGLALFIRLPRRLNFLFYVAILLDGFFFERIILPFQFGKLGVLIVSGQEK